jgi:aminoglycoside/choline kinase family phosphotransferase
LPVPTIQESRTDIGLLVMEDLGDRSLETALLAHPAAFETDRAPPDLLVEAVDLAASVATLGTPILARSSRAAGPSLDAARFRFEMTFFLEHFVRGHLGRPSTPEALEAALDGLADDAASSPHLVLCHRDFHSRNLIVRPSGRLAMVDIQDARWGPDAYDLASLLRDAYLPIPDDWVDPLVERFVERCSGAVGDPIAFRTRFHLVATQRMLKALGSFGYLSRIRGPRYLTSIPPTVARLRRSLPSHPATARLLSILEEAGALPADPEALEN